MLDSHAAPAVSWSDTEQRRGEIRHYLEDVLKKVGQKLYLSFPGLLIQFRDSLRGVRVRRPSLGAILFGLVPFIACCFSVSLWDRIYPLVLGIPFNFFWLIFWVLLTPLFMWGAYRCEAPHADDDPGEQGGSR